MRKNSIKNTRINGEVQKELSTIIRNEIKDPRIHPMTSVMARCMPSWPRSKSSPLTQCATSLVQVSQPRSGLEAEPPDLGGEG